METTSCVSVPRLQAAIRDSASLSHEGFSQIATLANLCLMGMKSRGNGLDSEDIVNTLTIIRSIAQKIDECIDYAAAEVGLSDGARVEE